MYWAFFYLSTKHITNFSNINHLQINTNTRTTLYKHIIYVNINAKTIINIHVINDSININNLLLKPSSLSLLFANILNIYLYIFSYFQAPIYTLRSLYILQKKKLYIPTLYVCPYVVHCAQTVSSRKDREIVCVRSNSRKR